LLDSLLQEMKMEMYIVALVAFGLIAEMEAGLLGAGFGHGSCAAFPFRSNEIDLDHVAGCPRWSECCTEFGYCHGRESWEKGYFRDCNGESNGTPLPGSVIRIEAQEAAKGDQSMTAEMLGISSEIWQQQVQKAVQQFSSVSLSGTSSQSGSSSSSGTSSSSQTGSSFSSTGLSSGFSGSQSGFGSSQINSNSLVSQVIAALQPQIASAVTTAVQGTSSSGSSTFNSNSINSNNFNSGRGESSSFVYPVNNNVQGTNTIDTDQLIALIVKQLEPQIASAVNNFV